MLWKTFDMLITWNKRTNTAAAPRVATTWAIDAKGHTLHGTGNNYTVPADVVVCPNANPTRMHCA